ncbi:putative transcription regulator mTERF family [Medicago truncatula]|uniref:Putative transcription regulator mTERF family n=1 Tax=Medicago truncatula TaxID=3880 RepID=A0A072VGJ1_MEDTR|nr:uncharacterized protein LOC25488149 [Medicago truncatula]KEH37280.1 mTERF protein [Medicago truncatula]RHN73217.1 putative transcription regulator mTERF family [Medicago truncatula]
MFKNILWRHRTTLLNPNPLFHHCPLPFPLHFCTNTSDSTSFAVSYLINNFGFDPQSASKLSSTYNVTFKNAQKPDSVLTFFRNYGFSDSQLRHTISKEPWLLSCNPSKRVLPKFQFFLSKGASTSDIVNIITKNPNILKASLDNKIIQAYQLIYRFLQSDKVIIDCVIRNPSFFGDARVVSNIRLLIANGVADLNIKRMLCVRSRAFQTPTRDMLKLVEELKDLGFTPSKSTFGVALLAKLSVKKTLWEEKVDAFKKWGWSAEDVLQAFRRQPHCMLTSIDKINLVMNFWVNQLGWDALALAKGPSVFSLSFEKRVLPRASVLQYLLKKGLRKKNASLTCPFVVSEKLFLDTCIKGIKESSYLLKLYEEKLNLAYTMDKTCTS